MRHEEAKDLLAAVADLKEKDDKASIAKLRYGERPSRRIAAAEVIGRWYYPHSEAELTLIAAFLAAFVRNGFVSAEGRSLSGAVFTMESGISAPRLFNRLISSASTEELAGVVPGVLRRLSAEGIAVDYAAGLCDAVNFNLDPEGIVLRWMQAANREKNREKLAARKEAAK